jgi:hypothetical protein
MQMAVLLGVAMKIAAYKACGNTVSSANFYTEIGIIATGAGFVF